MADSTSQIREKLATYLENAYGMENSIAETLEKQVNETARYPDIQARIQRHLDETKVHRTRMEERLKAYGKSSSGIKGALSSMLGNIQGAMSSVRSDELAMMARDDYAVEHVEIATYGMIIALAQLAGDHETIQASELNLRDEISMAAWLENHIGEATVLTLQSQNIELPLQAVANVQQTIQMALTNARSSVGLQGTQESQQFTTPQI